MTTTEHDLTTSNLALDELAAYPNNPRRGNVAAIAESLRVNGQVQAVVVNAGTLTGRRNEVLSGNHTVLAARSLGWTTIKAVLLDVDEDAARRVVLAMNRTHDLGTYDMVALAGILSAAYADPVGTGYDADVIGRILASVPAPTVAGAVPPPNRVTSPAASARVATSPSDEWVRPQQLRPDAGAVEGLFTGRPVQVVTIRFWTTEAAESFERYIGAMVDPQQLAIDLPLPESE